MASAWRIYDKAREYIGDSTIDLDTDVFYMALLSTGAAATISNSARSTWNSLTAAMVSTVGGGAADKTLSAVTWGSGTSAGATQFDCTAKIFSAVTSAYSNVQYAVIHVSGGQLLAWSKLSSSAFDITAGNTLTVTPNATNGIFEMTSS
jgi:hypothetical protein